MAKFAKGDKVKVKGAGVETIKAVYPKGKGSGLDPTQVDVSVDWYETDGSGMISDEDIVGVANSSPLASTNAVVQNAINARTARNAGIWSSTKEAEDRSDIFVRAALGRTKYNFESEAGTLRDVIKLLASAEQTSKVKKNTEKLKDILSRVEKAAALFKGI